MEKPTAELDDLNAKVSGCLSSIDTAVHTIVQLESDTSNRLQSRRHAQVSFDFSHPAPRTQDQKHAHPATNREWIIIGATAASDGERHSETPAERRSHR